MKSRSCAVRPQSFCDGDGRCVFGVDDEAGVTVGSEEAEVLPGEGERKVRKIIDHCYLVPPK